MMKRLIRLLFRFFILTATIVVGIMVVNTLGENSRQLKIEPIEEIAVNDDVVQRLSDAVKIKTISRVGSLDTLQFLLMDSFVIKNYPLVNKHMSRIDLDNHSILLKWAGKQSNLSPILLLAHLDVVDVEEATKDQWEVPPFSGQVKDGFIWGRGTMDDKVSVLGLLEAAEKLLAKGYIPNRTVYFAFGEDEEIGGKEGAQKAAAYFKEKGINFEYVLDEGLVVIKNALPGLDPAVAMIGVAEKGYTTLQLTARIEDCGHSSMPPQTTAIGLLSESIRRLEIDPFPGKIDGVVGQMFDYLGPEMNQPFKTVFANRWLTEGLLVNNLSGSAATSALIRTTTAPTIINAGVQENVLPCEANATINFRILPGENIASVIERVNQVIADERVKVKEVSHGNNPLPISPTNTLGFKALQRSIQEIYTETVVAPGLVLATTDSRHFTAVSDNIYRFLPLYLEKSDLGRIHGANERIDIEQYKQGIRFYHQLLLNSTK